MYLREMRNRDATIKLDITGSVLVTGGLASAIYGVVNTTSTRAWSSSITLSAGSSPAPRAWSSFFVLGGQGRLAPLGPVRVFKSRPLTTANSSMFLIGGTFFAMWYFLTYYFQLVLGYGPVKAGFAFFPMALGIIIGAQISSRLLSRPACDRCCRSEPSSRRLGFLWISLIKPADSYAGHILVPSFICAFAMGLLFAPLATAATAGVDRADAGLASGLLNTARQVGRVRSPWRFSPPSRPTSRIDAADTASLADAHVGLPARLPDLGVRDRRRVLGLLRPSAKHRSSRAWRSPRQRREVAAPAPIEPA